MSEFIIKLARVEAFEGGAQGKQVCAVFHIKRGPIGFHVPIYLQGRDFDGTELVQAANSLYRMFEECANHSKVWELSAMSWRPTRPSTALCQSPKGMFTSSGRVRKTDAFTSAGPRQAILPSGRPCIRVSAHAS